MARILVADDDHDIRHLVVMILTKDAHEVVEAEDGTAAWNRLTTERFDLAVLDVMMPGLSGLEVVGRCRAAGADLLEMPIISITARARQEDIDAVMNAGATRCVTKPFSPRTLAAHVAEVLDGLPPRPRP